MPTWTAPKTNYMSGDLVTAADLNAANDNTAYLFYRPKARQLTGGSGTIATSTFTQLTNASISLTVGPSAHIYAACTVQAWITGAAAMKFELRVDGVQVAYAEYNTVAGQIHTISLIGLSLPKSAGTYNIQMMGANMGSGTVNIGGTLNLLAFEV